MVDQTCKLPIEQINWDDKITIGLWYLQTFSPFACIFVIDL